MKEAADIFKAQIPGSGSKNSAADKNPSTQGALINEQDKRKGGAGGGGTSSAGGAASGSSGSSGSTGGKTGAGSNGTVGGGGGTVSPAPSSSSGNPALDVATFGPEGKSIDEAIRNTLGLDPNSPVPTPAVTKEGVPLQDFQATGIYSQFEQTGTSQPEFIDVAKERDLIASSDWVPNQVDLRNIAGASTRIFGNFRDLLFSVSLQPAESVGSLSLYGDADESTEFQFLVNYVFTKTEADWEDTATPPPDPVFHQIRLQDILTPPAEFTMPGTGAKVQLADVRKSFAPNARVFLYTVEGTVDDDFVQALANFFGARTTAFRQSILITATEIGETNDPFLPQLIKSYKLGFGDRHLTPPTKTFDRFEQLLDEPFAFTVFPRRG